VSGADFLDCCGHADPVALRLLHESRHDLESVQRCAACGGYWFYRFHEWTDWASGQDELTSWWTPLTPAEGERLAAGEASEELGFLRGRPSWMSDAAGVRRVEGSPDRPWS
jgi:hypothetical protein